MDSIKEKQYYIIHEECVPFLNETPEIKKKEILKYAEYSGNENNIAWRALRSQHIDTDLGEYLIVDEKGNHYNALADCTGCLQLDSDHEFFD